METTTKREIKTITCKLCGHINVPAADSHIFPKGFFSKMHQGEMQLLMTGDGTTHRNRGGVHDKSIICRMCEHKHFSEDDYGIQILKSHKDGRDVDIDGQRLIVFPTINRRTMRRFFASLLWRGHVSKLPYVRSVYLGPYEERIRSELLNDGSFNFIDVWVTFWRATIHGSSIGIHPCRFKNGVRCYRILLPNLECIVSLGCDTMPAVARGSLLLPELGRTNASTSISDTEGNSAWLMLCQESNPNLSQIAFGVLKSQETNAASRKTIAKFIRHCEDRGILQRKDLGPLALSFLGEFEK